MIVNSKILIIDDDIERKSIYRALDYLRINAISYKKYYIILDQLLYDLKHHLYDPGISRVIF